MKKHFFFALALLAGAAAFAQSGAAIDFRISSSKGMSGTLKIMYSSAGSRVEMNMVVPQMPGGGFSKTTLVKSTEPFTVYTIDDKNKTYSSTAISPTQQETGADITVKVLGTEKIAGYNCKHVLLAKGSETSEFWTTKEIADFEKYRQYHKMNKFSGSDAEHAALVKYGADGFIVKSITKDQRGGDMTMELVTFEKKDLPANLFEIPADYKGGSTPSAAPAVDAAKLQSMTPEERTKYIEEMKKKYGTGN